MKASEDILLSPLYNVILEVEAAIPGVSYNYTSLAEFRNVKTVEEFQLIYWNEIIQRAHLYAATSIKRIKKWYDAFQAAYQAENYYGFCAGLRGLIEACADSAHTGQKISFPIADN